MGFIRDMWNTRNTVLKKQRLTVFHIAPMRNTYGTTGSHHRPSVPLIRARPTDSHPSR